MRKVWSNVETWPVLQDISGEQLSRGSNKAHEMRGWMSMHMCSPYCLPGLTPALTFKLKLLIGTVIKVCPFS